VTDRAFRRPESVLVVVTTEDGQALLLQRADDEELWQSVTGSLAWDEAPDAGARRELLEETGIDGVPVASGIRRRFEIYPRWRDRYEAGTRWNLEHAYRLQVPTAGSVTIDPEEHRGFCWLPIGEAATRVFSWTNRCELEAML